MSPLYLQSAGLPDTAAPANELLLDSAIKVGPDDDDVLEHVEVQTAHPARRRRPCG
jgi:hypothetical protein